MRVFQFLQWVKQATPQARALATQELALAFIFGELTPQEAADAPSALLLMCEDEALLVRQMLAETLAPYDNMPLNLLYTLLDDVPEVACPLIIASPLLRDADLLALIALQNEALLWAVAQRSSFSESVLSQLFVTANEALAQSLLADKTLPFTPEMLDGLANRFPALHEDLMKLDELAPATRYNIGVARAQNLAHFLPSPRAKIMLSKTYERLALTISAQSQAQASLIHAIEAKQLLTPALLLLALYCGNFVFLSAVFTYLTGLSEAKITALLREKQAQGIEALFYKAALPENLLIPFRLGLMAWHNGAGRAYATKGEPLNLAVLNYVLTKIDPQETPQAHYLLSQLCAEAAREAAKHFVFEQEAVMPAPEPVLETYAETLYIAPLDILHSYQEEFMQEETLISEDAAPFEHEFKTPEAVNDDEPTLLLRYAQERAA